MPRRPDDDEIGAPLHIRAADRWPVGPTPQRFWEAQHRSVLRSLRGVKPCPYCPGAHWQGICDAGRQRKKP